MKVLPLAALVLVFARTLRPPASGVQDPEPVEGDAGIPRVRNLSFSNSRYHLRKASNIRVTGIAGPLLQTINVQGTGLRELQ